MTDRNSYWRRVLRGYLLGGAIAVLLALLVGPVIFGWYWVYLLYIGLSFVTLPMWAAAFDSQYGSIK